jgi:hypothetical protein
MFIHVFNAYVELELIIILRELSNFLLAKQVMTGSPLCASSLSLISLIIYNHTLKLITLAVEKTKKN